MSAPPAPPGNPDDLPELLRPDIEKYRDDAERAGRLPPELVASLRAAGAFRLYAPRELGGFEVSMRRGLEILDRLARIDGPVAWLVWNLNPGFCAGLLGPAAVDEIWGRGPDPLIVNGGRPGCLTLGADGFRLSGTWPMVSGADLCEWLLLTAAFRDGPDAPVHYYQCCVSRANVTVLDTWDAAGMRATNSTTVVADDVPVSPHMSFTAATPNRLDGPLYRIPFSTLTLPGGAAVLTGLAAAAVEEVVVLKKGTPHPWVHAAVGRAAAQAEAARLLLLTTADGIDRAAEAATPTAPMPPALHDDLRAAVCHAADTARTVLTAMYAAGGSASLPADSRLGRLFRDGQAAAQHVNLSPAGYEIAGRAALGVPPDGAPA
jgi:alkylation response protein AidB-like acyl-CoA dehydrogenase